MAKAHCFTHVLIIFGLAVLLTNPASAIERKEPLAWVDTQTPKASEINDAFSRVMAADPDLGQAVTDLESATNAAGRPWNAAQLLATAYDVVGRYEDARQIRNDHRKKVPPCIYTGQAWPDALATLPASVRVLLINEDHLDPSTRANLLAALPELYKDGFTTLALEAIPNTSTRDLIATGSVPDNGSTGTYLRDPIEALVIRQAVRLGFHLESYDTNDDFDVREAKQAANLNAIAHRIQGKLVVFAGHGHVQMEGGWMAEHLEKLLGNRMYTIDQTSNVGANCKAGSRPILTIRDRKQNDHLLGMKTDATLMTPAPSDSEPERSSPKSWLSLGTLRLPLHVSTGQLCPGNSKWCLIEARRQNTSSKNVPEDRYLTRGVWRGYLFVTPGHYTVIGIDERGAEHTVTVTR